MHTTPSPHRLDRERIVRSRSFRALAGKTQVVPLPRADRVRTRVSHVLEVTAIARGIAEDLALDSALAEAIALAHDLGHPPFGHVGERVLAHLAGHFHHAAHGVRVVETLDPMDLAPEVRAGILLHSKGKGPILPRNAKHGVPHATEEALVVRVADLVAYGSHDADDAQALGWVRESDLPDSVRDVLRRDGGDGTLGERIARAFSRDVVDASRTAGRVAMSVEGEAALDALRSSLYQRFYERRELMAYVPSIREVISTVYASALRGRTPGAALDHVVAMTDREATARHAELTRTRMRIAAP